MLRIDLKGNILEKSQTQDMMIAVDQLLLDGRNNYLINLNELNYMNSSGLNSLVALLTKARSNSGEAVVFGVNERIEKLIILTKLNTVFSLYKTEAEALQAIKEQTA